MHEDSESGVASSRPSRRDLIVGGGALAAAAGVAAVGMASPASALAAPQVPVYTPLAPDRFYDSRDGDGPLPAGYYVTIAPDGGWPPSYQAVCFNLTVVNTVGAGYVAAFPDDGPWHGNSSINWFTSNQIVANNVFTGFGPDGGVNFLGGVNQTDFVLDVVAASILTDVSSPTALSSFASVTSHDLPQGVQTHRRRL